MFPPIIFLLGGAILLAGKGRRSKGSKSNESSGTAIGTISARPANQSGTWTTWDRCESPRGSPVGTHAAYGNNGECFVFWTPETWDVVHASLQKEFNKLSSSRRKSICNVDECVPNPHATDAQLYCEWEPNPHREQFLISAVQQLYPQLSGYLPPGEDSEFFPKMVWTFTSNLFSSRFCGIGKVT